MPQYIVSHAFGPYFGRALSGEPGTFALSDGSLRNSNPYVVVSFAQSAFDLFVVVVGSLASSATFQSVTTQLNGLISWFKTPRPLQFFGASLLIIHEGSRPSTHHTAAKMQGPRVLLVDFGHTYWEKREKEVDQNTLFGVEQVARFVEEARVLCLKSDA